MSANEVEVGDRRSEQATDPAQEPRSTVEDTELVRQSIDPPWRVYPLVRVYAFANADLFLTQVFGECGLAWNDHTWLLRGPDGRYRAVTEDRIELILRAYLRAATVQTGPRSWKRGSNPSPAVIRAILKWLRYRAHDRYVQANA